MRSVLCDRTFRTENLNAMIFFATVDFTHLCHENSCIKLTGWHHVGPRFGSRHFPKKPQNRVFHSQTLTTELLESDNVFIQHWENFDNDNIQLFEIFCLVRVALVTHRSLASSRLQTTLRREPSRTYVCDGSVVQQWKVNHSRFPPFQNHRKLNCNPRSFLATVN